MHFEDGYRGLMNIIKVLIEEINKEIKKLNELQSDFSVLKVEIDYLDNNISETVEKGEIISVLKLRKIDRELLEYEISEQEELIKGKRVNLSALTEANRQLNWGGLNVPYPDCPR